MFLRITGGEPLLTKETRDKVNLILKKSIELGFQKVVLCTNGNYLGMHIIVTKIHGKRLGMFSY